MPQFEFLPCRRAVGAHLRESDEGTALPGKDDGRRMIGAALNEVIARWLAYCWQHADDTDLAYEHAADAGSQVTSLHAKNLLPGA